MHYRLANDCMLAERYVVGDWENSGYFVLHWQDVQVEIVQTVLAVACKSASMAGVWPKRMMFSV